MSATATKRFTSFREYYPAYLSEHPSKPSREFHFIGCTLALMLLIPLLLTGNFWWLLASIAASAGFAWVGHQAFERGQPVSLHQPVYAVMANWVMYWQMLTGQLSF